MAETKGHTHTNTHTYIHTLTHTNTHAHTHHHPYRQQTKRNAQETAGAEAHASLLAAHAELLVLDEDFATQGGRGRELIGVVVRQEGRQQL